MRKTRMCSGRVRALESVAEPSYPARPGYPSMPTITPRCPGWSQKGLAEAEERGGTGEDEGVVT